MRSRFNVGQSYAFINYVPDWHTMDGNEVFDLKIVKCEKEEEVPIAYSESKTQGYIFKDGENKEWYNQYPEASYGQASMSTDWYIFSDSFDIHEEAGRFLDGIVRTLNRRPFMGPISDEDVERAKNDLARFTSILEEKGLNVSLEDRFMHHKDGTSSCYKKYVVTVKEGVGNSPEIVETKNR